LSISTGNDVLGNKCQRLKENNDGIFNDTHYSGNNHLSIVYIDYHKYIMHMSMGRDHFWKTGEDFKKKYLITEIKFNNPVHDAHTLTG